MASKNLKFANPDQFYNTLKYYSSRLHSASNAAEPKNILAKVLPDEEVRQIAIAELRQAIETSVNSGHSVIKAGKLDKIVAKIIELAQGDLDRLNDCIVFLKQGRSIDSVLSSLKQELNS